ncbi:uncharacterized protein [Linepithema humile]|uniref:uncharacterized protein n=1 Tax=Linepithema humile TaxID=83485 RepID=UPI00351E4C81
MDHKKELDRARLEKLSLVDLMKLMERYGLTPLKAHHKCIDALVDLAAKETRDTSAQSADNAWQSAFSSLLEQIRCQQEQMKTYHEEIKAQGAMIAQLMDNNQGNVNRSQSTSFINPEPAVIPLSPFSTTNSSTNQSLSNVPPAQAVSLLASQIPVYSGTEDEDVELWVRRVELAASVHGISDNITLLACTSKLQKYARDWFDLETNLAGITWNTFKEAIVRRFKRRVPFHVAMQKVDARKWIYPKESFQEYANQKLKMMHHLQLPVRDRIQLLINGIGNMSLRGIAAMRKSESIEEFLEDMDHLVSSCGAPSKRNSPPPIRKEKTKDSTDLTKKTTSLLAKSSKDLVCNYCKVKGHIKSDCYKLKRKEQSSLTSSASAAPVAAAEESKEDLPTVACLDKNSTRRFEKSNSTVEICSLNNITCNLLALLDTGSPASFVRLSTYKKFIDNNAHFDKPVVNQFKALNDTKISVIGSKTVTLKLSALPTHETNSVFDYTGFERPRVDQSLFYYKCKSFIGGEVAMTSLTNLGSFKSCIIENAIRLNFIF